MASLGCKIKSVAILLVLLSSSLINASARSVHSTSEVDLFPQGQINSDGSWYLNDKITFTQDNADYTTSMVSDNRITFDHNRPANLQLLELWSQSSPSDSAFVNGAPDSSYSYTKGPVIEVTNFNTEQYKQYEIIEVGILVAFHIPGPLLQDQVRFTINNDGTYSELVTYVNTQGPIDYMNQTLWSKNITSDTDWSWSELENLIVTLDYVSLGNTDDTQLDVDAVGLSVLVEYPWYGTEWASVESTSTGLVMPVYDVDYANGNFNNLQIKSCGLGPITDGVEGTWTSEILVAEPDQSFGRIHFDTDESNNYVVEVSTSGDGIEFSDFSVVNTNQLIDSVQLRIRIITSDGCADLISVDYNDPRVIINGRVFGSLEGLATQYSRWKVFVNGQEAAYQLIDELSEFNLVAPIGQYLKSGMNDFTIKIQSWFNWDSSGSASNTLLEINSIRVTGGFYVEWDEDPSCQTIGPQYFVEDGSGILIPFLDRCFDDRTTGENLSVSISTSEESLISPSLVQDDIKLVLLPDQHGTATVTVIVTDEAENTWTETFVVYVEEIDDKPVVNEFPSVIPVETGVSTTIPFYYSDIDSTGLTVTADKSWVTIDLSSSTLMVSPPATASSVPIVLSVCDQTSCTNQTLVLEVLALAELSIEEIIVDSTNIREGDVVPVKIYVRNSGNSDAALISVRCQSGVNLVAIKSILLLQSGDLDVVTCDWRQTEAGNHSLSVELDRVNQITESDENNNIEIITVNVGEALSQKSSSDTVVSTTAVWVVTIVVVALMVLLFSAFAPKKIRKL
ncbi:MAG: CARDB domain-containing protein [Candidatus Thermoplasmatota archaeon]|nr:CARDB domain-containing protein [Candidatus Thermoplasmatota archaeon]